MKKRTHITIDGRRYDLTGMIDLGYSTRENGGACGGTAAWYGPRSKRIIIESDSIWQSSRNNGSCVGVSWSVYEPGSVEYGWIVEELERAGIDMSEAPLPVISESVAII